MGRTVFNVPGHPDQAYFFHGNTYARVKLTPGTYNEEIVFGPAKISDHWKELHRVGFDSIDAVVPVPGDGYEDQVYVFSGLRYVRYKFTPGTDREEITAGPHKITDYWASLRTVGFDTVDAVVPIPSRPGQAYFFSGSKYARIKFQGGGADEVIGGPRELSEGWPALYGQAGFCTVDAVLHMPGYPGYSYFFSGSQYVRIAYEPGVIADSVVGGGPAVIAANWKSLKWGW